MTEAGADGLAAHLSRLIERSGPLRVDRFQAEALLHPQFGYYRKGDRLGRDGDFITAPEISQCFGELLGLWVADMWERAGRPQPFRLVELGPGRGTLMRDALRAMRVVPDLMAALDLHLVESNVSFRTAQQDLPATWHESLDSVPDDAPLFLIANEFFDALPVRQWMRHRGQWLDRAVGLDAEGRLTFVLVPADQAPATAPDQADEGAVVEVSPMGEAVAATIGSRLAAQGGAALIVDYGYWGPAVGDTLQALKRHQRVPVLAEPGQADLTAHVDFAALARAALPAKAFGPVDQGLFLIRLGIEVRTAMLKRKARPEQAAEIDAAVRRLTAPDMMGRLFKVLALVPDTGEPTLQPPGFTDA